MAKLMNNIRGIKGIDMVLYTGELAVPRVL
jgi:hypothetical protein